MTDKKALAEFAEAATRDWPLPTRDEWNAMSLDDCHHLIQRIQASYQEGASILNQRVYARQREVGVYKCMVCGESKSIAIDNHPNYVWRDDRQDPQTRLYTTRYICSSQCYYRGSNDGSLTNARVPGNVRK